MKESFWILLIIIYSINIFSFSTYGQIKDYKTFSHLQIAEDLRKRLAERLNLFIEYEKTQQYEKQYDLLANEYLKELKQLNIDKIGYVEFKRKQEFQLLKLKITNINKKLDNNGSIQLFVKAETRFGNKTYYDEPAAILSAFLQDGNWYFSMWYLSID